jgi:serine/threonine-protein kinase
VTAHERIIAGRYALYGPIATGGMATVSFGRLLGPGGFARTVAIKKLKSEHLESSELVSTLIDEARLASRIQHPNVVATLDMVAEDDEVLLVMEYVPGESLARLLAGVRQAKGHVDVPVAASIVCGVLGGLHAAHEARDHLGEPLGIVHRDVTPENVLVGSDGHARLLDFGIAKGKGRLQTTRAGQLKGKVSYMSPEQILGEQPDRRSDVYAAAVVLWETLTCRRLFAAETSADNVNLIPRILEADLEPPSALASWVPRTLDPVVMRGLNRAPEARYDTAQEFAAAIEHASGIATPRRVSEWLESVAGDTLRARASELAAIERSADAPRDAAPVVETSVRGQRDKRLASEEPTLKREDLAKTLQIDDDEETHDRPPKTARTGVDDETTTESRPREDQEAPDARTLVYEREPPDAPTEKRIIKPSDFTPPVDSLTADVELPVEKGNAWPWIIAALIVVFIAGALWLRSH